jgi:hypothetical protein
MILKVGVGDIFPLQPGGRTLERRFDPASRGWVEMARLIGTQCDFMAHYVSLQERRPRQWDVKQSERTSNMPRQNDNV